MMLDTIRKQENNQVRFVVYMDGKAVASFGTSQLAHDYQDKLWATRSQSDKTMEALYSGR